MIEISWALAGHGAGSATVETIDDAAAALGAAVRDAFADHDADAVARVLHGVLGPLRMRLVTDGAFALEHGQRWESSEGPLLVTLRSVDSA